MTNNHCPKPEQIRTVISLEIRDAIDKFAKEIANQIYEFAEEQSFEAFRFLPTEWADCANCETHVLNAQEKALANINILFLNSLKQQTDIFN